MNATSWRYQDVLKLNVSQWTEALKDSLIFNDDSLRLVRFVYHQKGYRSTASEIAMAWSTSSQKTHYNYVCACNKRTAKALYKKYDTEPPIDENGEKRYWNVIFDGEPETPLDGQKHFYWRLRPNLILALEKLLF